MGHKKSSGIIQLRKGYDMDVALFSYRKGNTPVHRAPALLKLAVLCIISAAAFATPFPWVLLWAVPPVLSYLTARIPFSRLRKLAFVPVIGIMVTLFRLISGPDQLQSGLLYTLRFAITALSAMVMFETTSPIQLQYGLETLWKCICRILPFLKKTDPVPTLCVTISFIPEIFFQWEKISMAARARTFSRKDRIRACTAMITALLSVMLKRAEEKRRAMLNRSL